MDIPVLIDECNLGAPPAIVMAIIETESRLKPLALGINPPKNTPTPSVPVFKTVSEAATFAVSYVASGYSVDVGLMQVNSNNLARYNVSIAQAFDPCKNIELGSRVYLEAAQEAKKYRSYFPDSNSLLKATLSIYNTGDPWAGVSNGYAGRVLNAMSYGQDIAGADMDVSFTFDEVSSSDDGVSVPFNVGSNWAITTQSPEVTSEPATQEVKRDVSTSDR